MKKRGQRLTKIKTPPIELPDSRKNSLQLLEEQLMKHKTCTTKEKVSKNYLGSAKSRSPVANEDIDIYLDSCLVEKKNGKDFNYLIANQKEKICQNTQIGRLRKENKQKFSIRYSSSSESSQSQQSKQLLNKQSQKQECQKSEIESPIFGPNAFMKLMTPPQKINTPQHHRSEEIQDYQNQFLSLKRQKHWIEKLVDYQKSDSVIAVQDENDSANSLNRKVYEKAHQQKQYKQCKQKKQSKQSKYRQKQKQKQRQRQRQKQKQKQKKSLNFNPTNQQIYSFKRSPRQSSHQLIRQRALLFNIPTLHRTNLNLQKSCRILKMFQNSLQSLMNYHRLKESNPQIFQFQEKVYNCLRQETLKLHQLIIGKKDISTSTLNYKMMIKHVEDKQDAIKKNDANNVFYEE